MEESQSTALTERATAWSTVGIGGGLVADLMYECIVYAYVRVQSML
jgi:hypothetical protein